MLKYRQVPFKELQKGARVALPVKNKSLYLSTEEFVKEIATVRMFKIIEITENKNSDTLTVELLEIGFAENAQVQPLIFESNIDVFEVYDVPDEKVKEKDQRKVIKG